jgi:hypothetical protein
MRPRELLIVSAVLKCCAGAALVFIAVGAQTASASLNAYDTAVNSDATNGLPPLVKLTNAVTFTGANREPFNFGAGSGDVTIEFIVTGNPSASGASSYLAVGANATSNLRYKQFNNTGQLGFTQLGVADYLFTPGVPSPQTPVHIAYIWESGPRTMKLYLNGSFAGSAPGVSASFAMPNGLGWLGGNPSGTETMVGTVYRVTVYSGVMADDAVQRHADAYNDIVRAPIIASFAATPGTIFSPASSTLAWNVQNATGISINGTDVTALPDLSVAPTVTTTYSLLATNAGGRSTGQVTVVVNPAPAIHSFQANKGYGVAGETIALSWNTSYGQSFNILPGVGDVSAQTTGGTGSVNITLTQTTNFTLAAGSPFGTNMATLQLLLVTPASHLVISEVMADNSITLADEDGAFPDWLEIFNPSAGAINLAGYFLTDDEAEPTKWAFPSVSLSAGGHLIVFASGKNRVNPLARLHTNFQIDKAGEYLALIGPGPTVLHEFDPLPPQDTDISYGVLGGDVNFVTYMGHPTPGAINDSAPPPPAKVEFSRADGFFSQAFSLALSTITPGAVIRYTLNGTIPSATNGFVYSAPISINGTVRVRSVAEANGLESEVSGVRFIKLAADLTNYTTTLPIMVIENFGAGTIPQKGWNGTGAGIKQTPRHDAAWATIERSAGVGAFTNAAQMFSRIGIRGRGAFSSTWRQKPYSVEALKENGDERSISPLGLPAHPDWVLYFPDPDANKDPAMLFNTFAYELYQHFGRDFAVRFRWVEAFVNEDGGDLQLADRRGVYAIFEKVSRGADRLDFQKLSENGTNGGWLLSLNRMDPEPETAWPAANGTTQPQFFHTAGPNRVFQTPPNGQVVGDDEPQQSNGYLNFDNPSGYTINTNQRAAIENWFKDFEDVLWNNALWRDPTNGYRKYLDSADFADYFLLNTLTRNGDGLLISMFPWKGNDGKLRMGPAWDYNWSAYFISGTNPTGTLLHRPDRLWYKRLFVDVDFNQLYIDRWWDHRRGAMNNAGLDAIIDGQVADISLPKSLLNGFANTNDWGTNITQMKAWLKTRADWIDSNYIRPPAFNQNGGDVPAGFQIVISGTNGTIYFTTDGSDPRVLGGSISPAAQNYQQPFALNAQATVTARIRNGTNWSGLTKAAFYTPQDLSTLAITEIMFNPPAYGGFPGGDLEFLELKNTGVATLNLGALTFTNGINFTFPNGTLLLPGQFFVIARNASAFALKYPGVTLNGTFTGQLDNSGETLRIATLFGQAVLSVTYGDRAPWPVTPDGFGFSLVPRVAIANLNSDDGAHWRASSASGGSPGADDPASSIAPVLINEALTHTDLPAVDWVELFNPNAVAVNVGGWFLSDDGAAPKKFRIPNGTTIPAGDFLVFTEADFNATPGSVFSFSLGSAGDSIYLFSGDANTNLTGYGHGFAFGAAANGVTFGRYVNSAGEEQFPAQLAPTLNATNAGPRVGPVVISEIMYHPDVGDVEFVELKNITASAVPMFDVSTPTNTWRLNGIGFNFPTNFTLRSNEVVLIVATNPAVFRAKYDVPANVQIFGPYIGNLQDSGELLELQRPDSPDTNGIPWITVDAVRYNDRAPWPAAADGNGPALQRIVLADYGNDPTNWVAASASPGSGFIGGNAPVIVVQPQNQNTLIGGTAIYSVSFSNSSTMNFRWRFNGAVIPGATNVVLVLSNIQPAQAGRYSVLLYNTAGSALSVEATQTVLLPVTFSLQPTNQNVLPGTNVTLVALAAGNGPLRYQWRFEGTNILDATNNTYSFTGANLTNHHGNFSCVVADAVSTATSSNAFIYVLVKPGVVTHITSQTVLQGANATFSLVATGAPPLWYRWIRNGGSILGATTSVPVLVITNVQASGTIRVSVTNVALPNSGTGAFSPGPAAGNNVNLTMLADADGDGMWDVWETNYFGNNFGTNFALVLPGADPDGDGMNNRDEYIAGTNPTNALSLLNIVLTATNANVLQFVAQTSLSYSVQSRSNLSTAAWINLTSITASPLVRTVQVDTVMSPQTGERYYRVVTPLTP